MGDALHDKRVGFLGAGAMAEALSGGLLAGGFAKDQLIAADPDPARRSHFEEVLGIRALEDNDAVVAESDVVVVALKPDKVRAVLSRLTVDRDTLLWISIAAGVTFDRLRSALSGTARIVRAMPNTPAQVHTGATAICAGAAAREEDLAVARALFEAVGIVWQAPSEELLDAVTGLSGSGPAYVFVFLEALADAGVRVGLPREAAAELAVQTVLGAARLALETGLHPAVLKDRVASPGGTTIAGLERLEAGGLRAAVYEAVRAATDRSRELRGPEQPGRGR